MQPVISGQQPGINEHAVFPDQAKSGGEAAGQSSTIDIAEDAAQGSAIAKKKVIDTKSALMMRTKTRTLSQNIATRYEVRFSYQTLLLPPTDKVKEEAIKKLKNANRLENIHYRFMKEDVNEPFDKFTIFFDEMQIAKVLNIGSSMVGRPPTFSEKTDLLLKDAKDHFSHFRLVNRAVPDLPPNASPSVVIEAILDNAEGLVVGEDHHMFESKQFLLDNMNTLASKNVRTLFLEHLPSESFQGHLNAYANMPPGSPMPPELLQGLQALDRSFMRGWFARSDANFRARRQIYNFTKVVEAAQKAGIKTVAIDCEVSYGLHKSGLGETEDSLKNRLQGMNYLAHMKIIHRENPAKWVAFVGSSHVNTCESVPGIAELTGAVGVIVDEAIENSPISSTRLNVKEYAGHEVNFDVLISIGQGERSA